MSRAMAALAVVVSLGVTPMAAPVAAAGTSERFCRPLTDYYAIQFVVGIASQFAELQGDPDYDEDEVQATMLVGLSPKLVKLTEQMIAAAPKTLRKDLRLQLVVYRTGVALLMEAGASQKVIESIADAELDESDPVEQIAKRTKLGQKTLERIGRKYVKTIERLDKVQPSTPATEAAFELAFNECGILPDTRIACGDLLDDAAASAVLGAPATLDEDQGCLWETAENGDGDTSALAVDVYATTATYERFWDDNDPVERVPDVGDEAVAADEFSSSSSYTSCGRTVAARVGDRTVQVALCLGDRDVTTAQVAEVAQQVIVRI